MTMNESPREIAQRIVYDRIAPRIVSAGGMVYGDIMAEEIERAISERDRSWKIAQLIVVIASLLVVVCGCRAVVEPGALSVSTDPSMTVEAGAVSLSPATSFVVEPGAVPVNVAVPVDEAARILAPVLAEESQLWRDDLRTTLGRDSAELAGLVRTWAPWMLGALAILALAAAWERIDRARDRR